MQKVTIERYDEETDTTTEYELEVALEGEADEYVGGHLFSHGYVEITCCQLLDGTEFPITKKESDEIIQKLTDDEGYYRKAKHYPKWW